MKRVGKGEITMKQAWNIKKGSRSRSVKTVAKKGRRRYFGRKKKGGRKKKNWKYYMDVGIKATALTIPEIRTLVESWGMPPKDIFDRWIYNRTGFESTGYWRWEPLVQNYGASAAMLIGWKITKKMARW